ncbi:MAG: BON domain-containing protein [Rhodospirillaceae bacterium]|nr:BON domain-containing protein [Rhodospirillales bacterium]
MKQLRPAVIVFALASAGLLSGCAGAIIGAGASTASAASEERGLEGAIDDAKIRAEINHLWFQRDIEMYRQVTLTIKEGRVLLTGTVPNPDARVEAVRLSWQAAGVREVLNEVQVHGDTGFSDYAKDVTISQKMKSRLLFDKEIRNINYTVDVNDAVIYLMGVAQNDAELQRVIAYGRDISGVKGVVSHVRLKTDPRRFGG